MRSNGPVSLSESMKSSSSSKDINEAYSTKQVHKSLLPLNEKCIFENVSLVVVKMNICTMKVQQPTRCAIDQYDHSHHDKQHSVLGHSGL
ncbi:hypothetical protein YC2023_079107 [Brassica napus]